MYIPQRADTHKTNTINLSHIFEQDNQHTNLQKRNLTSQPMTCATLDHRQQHNNKTRTTYRLHINYNKKLKHSPTQTYTHTQPTTTTTTTTETNTHARDRKSAHMN